MQQEAQKTQEREQEERHQEATKKRVFQVDSTQGEQILVRERCLRTTGVAWLYAKFSDSKCPCEDEKVRPRAACASERASEREGGRGRG